MVKLSKKVINEVKSIAPGIRKELKNELVAWESYYVICAEFYSDKFLLELLPYAAYEYIVLVWNIEPKRLNRDAVVKALNGKVFKDIQKITAHALRQIACIKTLK